MPRLSLLLGLCLLCAACAAPGPSVAITAPTPTAAPATLTSVRLPTQPTFTATPAPSATSTPPHVHTSTPTVTHTPIPLPIPVTVTGPGAHPQTPLPLGPTTSGRIEHFQLVGRHDLGRRGWHTGLALAESCAYIGNRRLPQVAILDISDPTAPELVNELVLAPGSRPVELRTVPDLNLLVVMNFSPGISFITYDISDCRNPQPLGSLGLGAVPHEFYLWRDPAQPARLLAYAAMFYDIRPDLHVVDLTDPTEPVWLGSWTAAADGAGGSLHSLTLSPDGRLAYLALRDGGLLLADTSDFAAGLPEPRLRLIRDEAGFAPAPAISAHSAVPLADPRFVLVTEEVYVCPFRGLYIADVQAPARPSILSRFTLPENDAPCAGRPDSSAVYTAHNPLIVGDLAFITWYGGGLQALDLTDATHPVRVGLYVPDGTGAAGSSYLGSHPVQLWSFPILRDGLLYISDIQTGLHILRYTGPYADIINAAPLAEGNVTILP